MPQTYHDWAIAHQPRPDELAQMRSQVASLAYRPVVSLVMPTYNTPEIYLREAIDSVLAQVYPDWELCIADDCSPDPQVRQILEEYCQRDRRIKVAFRQTNGHISQSSNSALALATGDYVGLLDHDDLLEPHALYEVVALLNQYPYADMIYSDEDKIDQNGRFGEPACKSAWCPDAMLSRMYTCHFGVYRREILKFIGGFRLGYEGSQDYDLVLRFTERTKRVYHIPKVLYHWRIHSGSAAGSTEAKPYAYKAAMMALGDAIQRRDQAGWVIGIQERPGHYRIRYEVKPGQTASVVITARPGEAASLDRLLTAMVKQSPELLREIWVVAVDQYARPEGPIAEDLASQGGWLATAAEPVAKSDELMAKLRADRQDDLVDFGVRSSQTAAEPQLGAITPVASDDPNLTITAVLDRHRQGELAGRLRYVPLGGISPAAPATAPDGTAAEGRSLSWSARMNQIAQLAQGSFLLFLDCDLAPHSGDWLAALAEQAQRPEIGAAGGMLLTSPSDIYHVGMALNLAGKQADCLYRGATGSDVRYTDLVYVDLQNNCTAISSALLMCRRDRFLAVGGFDERLAPPAAEVDLGLNLRSRGWHNIYLPHVQLLHPHPDPWLRSCAPSVWLAIERENSVLLRRKWGEILDRDICYSPLLAGSGDLTGAALTEYYALQDRFIMGSQPLVSVCVPTYNGDRFLAEALATVAAQTYRNLEVLIWDDGSTDQTLEIAEAFRAAYPHLRCRVDRHDRLGMAGNWTACAQAARGKYVKFLHQDDRLEPECIEAMVALAERDPEVGLVFAPRRLELTPEAAADPACQANAQAIADLHRAWSRLEPIQAGSTLLADPQLVAEPLNKFGEPTAVLLRRSLFGPLRETSLMGPNQSQSSQGLASQSLASQALPVGGFDGRLRQLLDLDFWWRVLVAGYRVGFVDRPLTVRRIHPDQGTQQNRGDLLADAAQFYDRWAQADVLSRFAPTVQSQILALRDRLASSLPPATAKTETETRTVVQPNAPTPIGPSIEPPIDEPIEPGQPPTIAPIAPDQPRPLWSVVIPTYNPGTHFEALLTSLLSQAPGPAAMEILVLDDASAPSKLGAVADRVAAIARQFPHTSVAYHRQAQNLGLLGNWNDGIRRSTGRWVHVLHQDDLLLPGFYDRLGAAIAARPEVGAVICRHHHINDQGQVIWTSEPESDRPGIITDWLDRLATRQRMQFVATVVRRDVYETLGGFWSAARSAADWEMWLRLSSHYPIWFEPEVLAAFRRHDQSTTSRLVETGQNIADTRRVIELAQTYLPTDRAATLRRQALDWYGNYALGAARTAFQTDEISTAIAQLREALRCNDSVVMRSAISDLLTQAQSPITLADIQRGETPIDKQANPAQADRASQLRRLFGPRLIPGVACEPAPLPGSPEPPTGPNWVRSIEALVSLSLIFQPIANEVNRVVNAYHQAPEDPATLEAMRYLRYQMALQWWEIPLDRLQESWDSRLGQAHRLLMSANLRYERRLAWEQDLIDRARQQLGHEGPQSPSRLQAFIILMLFCRAYELPLSYETILLPSWFTWWYSLYLLEAPLYFQAVGEADRFREHLVQWTSQMYISIAGNPGTNLVKALLSAATYHGVYTPLYFCQTTERRVYQQRAEIIETTMNAEGRQTAWRPGPRPSDRRRLRVGVLKDHFNPQTETFSTLPYFEDLDRTRFEVILYAVRANNHPLEHYCASRSDRFVHLPEGLNEQVDQIRGDDLDALLIGTNVTMVTNPITLLASHRLARVQIMNNSAPVTTGMRHVDAYLSGTFTEAEDLNLAQNFYQEQLVCFEGPAHCFNYDALPQEATIFPTRSDWGAGSETVIFLSGANFNKLVPELRHTWARILAAVPDSILVLYPFNPNWGQNYPAKPFIDNFQDLLETYGVDRSRLKLIRPLPTSADIRECLKLGDLYLDSFPFAGVNSTVDPLLVGLPPIVFEGSAFRERMASALMRSLQIPELVARNETDYIDLAIALARDPVRRQHLRDRITTAMAQKPIFLDPRAYSAQMGQAIEALVRQWDEEQGPVPLARRQPIVIPAVTRSPLVGSIASPPPVPVTSQPIAQPVAQPIAQVSRPPVSQPTSQPVSQPTSQPVSQPVSPIRTITAAKLTEITGQATLYRVAPNAATIAKLNQLRRQVAEFWLTQPEETLVRLYASEAGQAFRILLNCGLNRQAANPEDQAFVQAIATQVSQGQHSIAGYMALMLYFSPGAMRIAEARSRLPAWLLNDYLAIFEPSEPSRSDRPHSAGQAL